MIHIDTDDYKPNKKMQIEDVLSNKKQPIVTEFFLFGRKLRISFNLITQS